MLVAGSAAHVRRVREGRLSCLALVLLATVWLGLALAAPRLVAAERPASLPAAEAIAAGGWGPFAYSTQAPLQQLRFSYLHEGPQLVPAGTWSLKSAATWTNTWDYHAHRYRVDYESLYARMLLRRGLTEWLSASLDVPVLVLGGGILDRSITDFHEAFGLSNMQRDLFPHDQLRMERYNKNGSTTTLLDKADAGWYVRPPVVSLRLRLLHLAPGVPLTLVGAVNLPSVTGEDAFLDAEGQDWALGLATGARLAGGLATNVSLAVIHPRDGGLRDGVFRWTRRVLSAMVSADYALDPAWALVVQLNYESAGARSTRTAFDEGTYDIVAGAKWLTPAGVVLEFGLIENILLHENNIDFGLHIGVSMPRL